MSYTIPQALHDAIKQNQLIIFVGSGLSINHGLPSWHTIVKNLLINKKGYIEKADAWLNALESEIMTPLDILDNLKHEKKLILESFENDCNITHTESLIHQTITKISKRFITTNYDQLLEKNCEIANIMTQSSNFKLSTINDIDSFILKIHGDITEPDHCIIFKEQYEMLYRNDNLAKFQFQKLLSQYSFLFIGFSFKDPYVEELFNYINSLMDGYGPKHFLVNTHDVKNNHLTQITLENYSHLPSFLNELKVIALDNTNTITNTSKNLSESSRESMNFQHKDDGSDIAPSVSNWIGREKELSLLQSEAFKVFFITGIGGEGKSALASHYINNENNYSIIDWKDFKEEEHKFILKIYSMIKRVEPSINLSEIVGFSEEELIALFFKYLGTQKTIFVLDNVDSYIDLEYFEPIGGIGKFFHAAIKYDHKSKFIFTCRPFIRYAGVDFHQLKLEGLSESDTIQYFLQGNTTINKEKLTKYAIQAYNFTHGHALWLSLILAQSRKGEDSLKDFLLKIETGHNLERDDSSILAKKLLGRIWELLQDRERLVLRTLAEAIVPETKEDYADIMSNELNYNKFQKALKSLYNLNLIIEKRDTTYIELHPLVKEFIRTNYPTSERNKYITLFIQYYDKFIVILKNKLNYTTSFDEFLNFTNKTELSINAGDYQSALNTLLEISSSMTAAGFIEEYLRVVKLFFNSITWSKKKIETYLQFDVLLNSSIKYFVEYGESDYADELIAKYEEILESKGESYFRLCATKCYLFWFRKEYDNAINISEQIIYLLDRGEQEDKFDIKHNQALALRDTGTIENIDKALTLFLLNNTLDTIIDKNIILKDGGGAQHGNIGKCLYLKNMKDEALICYYKSFYYIFTNDITNRLINLGYAAFWIGQVLIESNTKESAYYFYKYAQEAWAKSSPVLLNNNTKQFTILQENHTSKSIASQEFWKIQKSCIETIEKSINVKFKLQ
ncbi:MAG: hypothetical protein H6Q35_2258 [Proteobacteria bacterium]|nr:hypothetical protein [Pseudomonadota bacterium]